MFSQVCLTQSSNYLSSAKKLIIKITYNKHHNYQDNFKIQEFVLFPGLISKIIRPIFAIVIILQFDDMTLLLL